MKIRFTSLARFLALAALAAWPTSQALAQNMWTNVTGDFNVATSWFSNSVPTGNVNAANDNGSNNVVLIQAGDPVWSHGDTRAGNGNNVSGAYLQTGSTNITGISSYTSWLRLGLGTNSVGYYTLSNGVCQVAGNVEVGEIGTGYLKVAGGTLNQTNASGRFTLADAPNFGTVYTAPVGTMEVDGGNVIAGANTFVVGDGQNNSSRLGKGTLIINGGTLNHAGNANFVVGRQGAKANLIMTGGVLNQTNAAGILRFAVAATTAGTNVTVGNLTMSGGTINCAGEFDLATDNNGAADGGSAYATNNMSGGAINVGSWLAIGRNGAVGVWNMTGGSVTELGTVASVAVTIGAVVNGQGPSIGIINQSGGAFTNTAMPTYVGEHSQGTWNLSGTGLAMLGIVHLSQNSGAVGVFNLNGGDLFATQVSGPGGGGTFNFNGGRLHATTSSTTFMQNLAAVYVLDGGAIIDTSTNNVSINSSLYAGGTGIGGLTKLGSGTLTLNGASSYTGSTVISNGTLAVVPGMLVGSGPVVVCDGAQLSLTNGGATLFTSALTLGPGTSTLQINLPGGNPPSPTIQANTVSVSGTATINIAGTALLPGQFPLIQFNSASGLGNIRLGSLPPGVSATLVQTPTSLDLNIQSAGKQLVWNGAANSLWDTTSANWADLNNSLALTTYSQPNGFGDLVTFDDSATNPTAISLSLAVSPVSMTFNNNGLAYSFAGPGKITGITGMTLNGYQSVTLGTSNDYTNGTLLNAGTLYVGADQALGLGPVTLNQGTLASASTAGHTLPNQVILKANSIILGDTVNSGPLTLAGKLDLGGGNARTLSFNSDVVVTGSLTNGGFTTKTGPGRLIIQGNSAQNALVAHQQGDVIVDGALLANADGWRMQNYFAGTTLRFVLTNGATFTLAANTGNVRVGYAGGDNGSDNVLDIAGTMNLKPTGNVGANSSVQLGASGANDYVYLRAGALLMCRAIVGSGPANTEVHFQGGTLMPLADEPNFFLGVTNAYIENGGLTIDTTNFTVTIAQALVANGTGGLTKLGSGSLTLNGADTYSGPTAVNAGKLILGSAHAATGLVSVVSNATLAFLSSTPGATVSVPSVSSADGAFLEAQYTGLTGNPTTPAAAINNLTLNGTVGANVVLATIQVGQFPLFGYTTLGGTGKIVPGQLPHGVVATIVTNTTAKTIDLVVSSVNPLLWAGTVNGTWNTSTTNWTLLGLPSLYSQSDNVKFDDSALISSVTMTQAVTPTSVLFSNNNLAYTLAASGAGKLSGATGLVKDGTNSLTLTGTNDFNGDVTVKAGMLILGNAYALGSTNGSTYVNSGATLNMKDIRLATQLETIYIIGQGYNNLGALYSDAGSGNGDFFRDVRLLGDTWVGTATGARFGFTDPSAQLTCVGGPYKFTKVGTGQFDFEDATITLGDVEVQAGVLQVANYTTLNSGYGITLQPGSEFRIYNLLSPLNRPFTVNNALINITSATVNQLSGNITLNTAGTFQVGAGFALTLAGTITGSGDLIKTNSTGLLTLNGINTYTGSTYIQGGTLALGAGGSMATTPLLSVSAGATLDISAVAPWVLGASQTLAGAGTVNGSVQANGSVALGSTIATLTFNNDLTLAGTTTLKVSKAGGLTNDLIVVSGALTYGGQLQVVLSGSTALAVNDTFKLFSFASAPAGSFAHISLPTGYTWDTTQLASSGTIKVTGVLNPPQPHIASVSIINGAFVFSGTNGATGGSFTVLGSTNVALPLAQWFPVSTNTFDASGNFSVTNHIDPTKSQMFYRLQ